jgi:hypothetical protein
MTQASESDSKDLDAPPTPRASRAKRRLTIGESARPKVTVKPMATRSKVGSSSRRTSFRDQADLQDIFGSHGDKSEDEEVPSVPEKKRLRRASNPSASRPALLTDTIKAARTHVIIKKQEIGSSSTLTGQHQNLSSTSVAKGPADSIDKRKIPTSSTIQKPGSISTAKHILGSMWQSRKDRAISSGQTIRSKAVQAYGARNSSSSLMTDKHSIAVPAQSASPMSIPRAEDQPRISYQPTPPPPVSATAPASQLRELSLATAPLRTTPPTSPTTRALVGFIGPEVAALRASRETESVMYEDTSLEETSLDSLEGPNIMTPHIAHFPVDDSSVPRLASFSPHPKREESPDFGSESSYYDRSLYGPSSPPCLPGADSARSATGIQSMNGSQSANGGHSVNGSQSLNGGPSNFGTRSVYEDLDPHALDDEEFELLIYGERTEGRTEAEGDEMTPVEESSGAEPMDICSDDGDSGPTRTGGPAHGDPVQ